MASDSDLKIIEWEDLQQELARAWSLSSALRTAKERKESLAQKLEEVIKVESLSSALVRKKLVLAVLFL